MSPTIDAALTDRIAALIRETDATEAARPPVEAEVASEIAHLDALAAQADAASASSLWIGMDPSFHTSTFTDSLLSILMAILPQQTKQLVAERTRRRAETWRGLRLTEAEKTKRLGKLRQDLRVTRAKLEQRPREIEQQTGEIMPRTNDDPGVWLLPPAQLDALAAAGNGRAR